MIASVIIPTYRGASCLEDAVRSICQQKTARDFEIVVVDNALDPETETFVQRCVANRLPVRYVREPKVGLHHARHTGARCAEGSILVYVDDDVLVPDYWLEALLASFDDPSVACVGGPVVPKWESTPPDWMSEVHAGYFSLLDLGDERRILEYPEMLYGCNFSIRKRLLFDLGGFNPDGFADRRFRWYRGDGEIGLQKKVYKAGLKIVYAPKALVWHRIPSSRLTAEYLCRRAFQEGVSGGYTLFREKADKPLLLLAGWLRAWLSLGYRFLRMAWASARHNEREIVKARAHLQWSWARAAYGFHYLCDPMLRKHVRQRDYL